jgi:uncharacterized protein YukE
MVRLQESELRDLAARMSKQNRNVNDVMDAGRMAVSAADADWRSSAFESFKQRWNQDRAILDRLAAELQHWNRKLEHDHAPTAHRVNLPFQQR